MHTYLGDIDQEVELAEETNFALVNARHVTPCIWLLVLDCLDKEAEDTDWVIARLKGDLTAESNTNLDESVLTQKEMQVGF